MAGLDIALAQPRPSAGAIRPTRFLNRELSWLDFNARVLALAEDPHAAAARAGQVPRHLQPEPRRVLRGAGLGPHGAARRRPAHHDADGLDLVEQLRAIRDAGRRARRPGRPRCSPTRSRPRSRTPGSASLDWDELVRRRPRAPRRPVRRVDLPGAHPARRRPRAPVPLHLEPVAQPRRHRARPVERRRALRPGEGAAAAPALRRRCPTASASCCSSSSSRPSSTRCSPAWRCSRTTRSASPATPTSSSRTKPRTSSRRSSRCCAGAASSGASCGSRSTPR